VIGMMQQGDKTILGNVAKVIAVLVAVMFSLIFLASYIGSTL
jgi:type IV secretory pathway VirB2 component (pilin)